MPTGAELGAGAPEPSPRPPSLPSPTLSPFPAFPPFPPKHSTKPRADTQNLWSFLTLPTTFSARERDGHAQGLDSSVNNSQGSLFTSALSFIRF